MATRASLLAEIQQNLKDSAVIWSADELYVLMTQVAREIAERKGLEKRANLELIEYTNDFSISGLTDLMELLYVEYPIHGTTHSFRAFDKFGTNITINKDTVEDREYDTLTGTVTFTQNSRSVSGSGTAFSTELTGGYNGDLICISTGTKYYQVSEVVSDTSLTLYEPFEETGATDTADSTKYRNYLSCARVYYTGTYTIDGSTCNITNDLINIEVLGVVAKAATEYAQNYARTKLTNITTLLSSASTSAGNISARITQAITDISTNRTNLATNLSSYTTTMTDVETALDAIVTELANAKTNINSVVPGKNITENYTEIAKTRAEEAKQRIDKARSYLDSAKQNHDYIDIAAQELQGAASYAQQSSEYMKQAEQSINVEQIVRNFLSWANMKMAEYQDKLNKLGRIKVQPQGTR